MKRKNIIMISAAVVALAAGLGWYGYSNSHKVVDDMDETEEVEKVQPVGPEFNADSAYAFTKQQCDFGPRDMNSKGHDACEAWIISKFKSYGCKVTTQKADLKGYDGTMLKSTNIMAQYNPSATTRILLCAHWDSRPWADNDPDSTNWHKPILAANDAASGVAVMLEIARLLQKNPLPSGTLKTGARPNGKPIRTTKATRGPWAPSISPPICHKAMRRATVFCSTWWADSTRSSIRKGCRNSLLPRL